MLQHLIYVFQNTRQHIVVMPELQQLRVRVFEQLNGRRGAFGGVINQRRHPAGY